MNVFFLEYIFYVNVSVKLTRNTSNFKKLNNFTARRVLASAGNFQGQVVSN
jgi:hypothetical protein